MKVFTSILVVIFAIVLIVFLLSRSDVKKIRGVDPDSGPISLVPSPSHSPIPEPSFDANTPKTIVAVTPTPISTSTPTPTPTPIVINNKLGSLAMPISSNRRRPARPIPSPTPVYFYEWTITRPPSTISQWDEICFQYNGMAENCRVFQPGEASIIINVKGPSPAEEKTTNYMIWSKTNLFNQSATARKQITVLPK